MSAQAQAERWSFAMATPEAVLGGWLPFVLERLHAHGFQVRATRLIPLDFARLARMYSHSDHPPPPTSGPGQLPEGVMTQLYALAPACVLALHRIAGDAPAALLGAKGATWPERAAPDSVRAAGEHPIFNFLHCPDDAESAAVELGFLVGQPSATRMRAWAEAPEAPGPYAAFADLAQLQACLPAQGHWEVLSFPMVAHRLRRRAVQALALLGPDDPAFWALLRQAQNALQQEGDRLRSPGLLAHERLRLAQAAHPRLHALLGQASEAAGQDCWLAAWAALDQLVQPRGVHDLAPLLALTDQGLYLGPSERLCLDAHAHALG